MIKKMTFYILSFVLLLSQATHTYASTQMSFTGAPTVTPGSGGDTGSIGTSSRWANVATVNGTAVDMEVTLLSNSNPDANSVLWSSEATSAKVTLAGEGSQSVDLQYTFYENATNTEIVVSPDVIFTQLDGGLREEIVRVLSSQVASYTLDSTSSISVAAITNGAGDADDELQFASSAGSNLVQNPGFESSVNPGFTAPNYTYLGEHTGTELSVANWGIDKYAFFLNNSTAFSGNQYFNSTSANTGSGFLIVDIGHNVTDPFWTTNLTLESEKTYAFSAYLANVGIDDTNEPNVDFYLTDDANNSVVLAASGELQSGSLGAADPLTATTQWQEFTSLFTTAAGKVNYTLSLISNRTGLANDYGNDLGMDDVVVREILPDHEVGFKLSLQPASTYYFTFEKSNGLGEFIFDGSLSPFFESATETPIDITAPSNPSLAAPYTTTDTTPTLSGSAEAHSIININVAGAVYEVETNSAGNWQLDTESVSPSSGSFTPITDGSANTVLLTSTDTAGNTSSTTSSNIFIQVPSGANSSISANPNEILATGSSTSTITVQAKNASGSNLTVGGSSVSLTTNLGSLSSVTDNGNGTYTATLTSTTTVGTATITGTIDTQSIASAEVSIVKLSITINTVAGDDIVDATEDNGSINITGMTNGVEDGQLVTLGLNGGSYSGNVSSNTWSIPISSAALQALKGSETVTADVNNLAGDSAVQAVRLITAVNDAPTISGSPAVSVAEDAAYSFTPVANDVDSGDVLSFSIVNSPSWASFDTNTGALTGTPVNADVGDYNNIVISVTDTMETTALSSFNIAVTNTNDAPTISGSPAVSVAEDAAYSFTPSAADVDSGDVLSFSIVNSPSWASFDTNTGALTGTPVNADVGDYNNIVISVTDTMETTALSSFNIAVTNTNDAPTISGSPAVSVAEDAAYSFTPVANDVDSGDVLSFSIVNSPSWASFDTNTGALTGTPVNADVGDYNNIIISVTDTMETTALSSFNIAVTNTNDAPVVTLPYAPQVQENDSAVPFTNTVDVNDVDGDDLSISLSITGGTITLTTSNLVFVSGDGVDDSNTTFTGTLSAINAALDSMTFTPSTNLSGNNTGGIQISANDSNGGNDSKTLSFDITAAGTPQITLPNPPVVNEDDILVDIDDNIHINDSDNDDQTLTLSATGGTITLDTTGLSFTLGDGIEDTNMSFTGSLTDVNTALDSMNFNAEKDVNGLSAGVIEIQVSDDNGSTMASFSFDITAIEDSPVVTITSPATISEDSIDAAFDNSLDIFDGDNDPQTVTLNTLGGTLSISTLDLVFTDGDGSDDTTMTFSGSLIDINTALANATFTPDANLSGENVAAISIETNDGKGNTDAQSLSFDIAAQADAPVISGTPTTRVISDSPYTFTPTASDDDADATLFFQIENKPSWANFNTVTGELSGTPSLSDVGINNGIVITVSDGDTLSSLAPFDLTVIRSNEAPIALNQTVSVVENVAQTIVLVASDTDGDELTYALLQDPSHGSISGGTQTLIYTPNLDYVGPDTFTFVASDGIETSTIATVQLTVLEDLDADGTPDLSDNDDDNDGLSDAEEGVVDSDGDGIIDSRDTDSDNDGLMDSLEGLADSDGDGTENFRDNDSDNDTLPDALEGLIDSDGDGEPNYLDRDSDGDSIPDAFESGVSDLDSDADGIVDAFDVDNTGGFDFDNNGVDDLSQAYNTDGDVIADYLDLDSDNDGLPDQIESGSSGIDSDFDGIDDQIDVDQTGGIDQNLDGIDDLLSATDSDGDGTPDHLDADSDGDLIPDAFESGSSGIDSDNDGIDDTFDVDVTGGADMDGNGIDDFVNTINTDNDSQPDYLDIDSDADGIPDIMESGAGSLDLDNDGINDDIDVTMTGGEDLNGDGIDDAFDAFDSDQDGTPDYRDSDSDNDGISDQQEARLSGLDTDLDGIDDNYDADFTGGVDFNKDGIDDDLLPPDSDNDGIPDYLDTDSDQDGLSDFFEGAADNDGDNIPDYLDSDSDNDGLADINERSGDTDGDGIADYLDDSVDQDGDGIPDALETLLDSDGDGISNLNDRDSDNDGIPDALESGLSGIDTDNNGIDDSIDISQTGGIDLNNDGIDDQAAVDTDSDGQPDSADNDSDNDGLPDAMEFGLSGVDTDSDGIDDSIDVDFAEGSDENNDGIIDQFVFRDTDGDGIPDYRDADSDNDGISDGVENLIVGLDSDNDGIDDKYDIDVVGGTDANLDGIADASKMIDSDNDGIANAFDLDSDNDGLLDSIEAGMVDSDQNGLADLGQRLVTSLPDRDGDGEADMFDLDSDNDGRPDIEDTLAVLLDGDNDGRIDSVSDIDGDGLDDSFDRDSSTRGSLLDNDLDGIPESDDIDDDNDGIPDVVEGNGDIDGDGIPNRLDRDSDNDGLSDWLESGLTNPSNKDTNNDGLDDAFDPAFTGGNDSDGDGIPDRYEVDSDNDGLSDNEESVTMRATGQDLDRDGVDDGFDPDFTFGKDDNGDGIDDAAINTNDLDSDGLLAYQDLDSDGDNYSDQQENGDFNNDGIADHQQEQTQMRTAAEGGSMSHLFLLLMASLIFIRRGIKVRKQGLLALIIALYVAPISLVYAERSDERRFYLGGGMGISKLEPVENGSGWLVSDDKSDAYKIFVGYQFKDRWFAELDYSSLGEATVAPRNTALGEPQGITYKAPSASIGYSIFKPDNRFNLFIRAGFAAIQNKNVGDIEVYQQNTSIQKMLGAGLEWKLTQRLFLRAEATSFDIDAQSYLASIGYVFNKRKNKRVAPSPIAPLVEVPKPRDDDNDGVFNIADECPGTPKNKAVNTAGCPKPEIASIEIELNILFDSGRSEIKPIYHSEIEHVAMFMRTHPNTRVIIEGHTDDIGETEANQQLSQQRALAVMGFLRDEMFISVGRLTAIGYGESKPISREKTRSARIKNRRVIAKILQDK